MKFPIGLRVNATINNITPLGIFVTLPRHHHGLIHHRDFGERWSNMKNNFEKGQEIRVVVVGNKNGKLALSLTRVDDPNMLDPTNQFNQDKHFAQTLTKLISDADRVIEDLKVKIN